MHARILMDTGIFSLAEKLFHKASFHNALFHKALLTAWR